MANNMLGSEGRWRSIDKIHPLLPSIDYRVLINYSGEEHFSDLLFSRRCWYSLWNIKTLSPPFSKLLLLRHTHAFIHTSLAAQLIKNPTAMQETLVRFLGWDNALEKGWATHSSILAWRIPWRNYSISPRGHKELDMTEWLSLYTFITGIGRRKWNPLQTRQWKLSFSSCQGPKKQVITLLFSMEEN